MRWQNPLALLVGIALGLSPWLLGFADEAPLAGWAALVCGAAVIVLASVAMERVASWPYWMLALTGTWLALSPLTLGFEDAPTAAATAIAAGTALFLIGSVSLVGSIGRSAPIERRTGRAPRIGAFRGRFRERRPSPLGRPSLLRWARRQSDASAGSARGVSRPSRDDAASRASSRRRSSR